MASEIELRSVPIRPPLVALTLLAQVLSNLLLPGLGLVFVALLSWSRIRASKPLVVGLLLVGVLSVLFLVGVMADVVWGPQVGASFG